MARHKPGWRKGPGSRRRWGGGGPCGAPSSAPEPSSAGLSWASPCCAAASRSWAGRANPTHPRRTRWAPARSPATPRRCAPLSPMRWCRAGGASARWASMPRSAGGSAGAPPSSPYGASPPTEASRPCSSWWHRPAGRARTR